MKLDRVTTWFDEYNSHGDYEKATKVLEEQQPDFEIRWVKIDDWRGHLEAVAKKGTGWRAVTEIDGKELPGWITGEWSDAPDGTRSSQLDKLLKKLDAKEAKIIFLPTSNIFSTAYDLFVR